MNLNDQKRLSEFMKQKKDCLSTILEMTREMKFKVAEEDVERIYNFLNKRELLFKNCKSLDKKIKEFIILDEDKESSFYKNVEKTEEETRNIIEQIIVLDKRNQKIMTDLLRLIKDNLRNLKKTQQVKQGYDEFYINQSYKGFDSKG